MAKQQKVVIEIPDGYTSEERRAIAAEILGRIVERTRDEGKGVNGRTFPGYSAAYKDSLEFKIAGKGKMVDLTLSSEMLDEIQLLTHSKGKITLGYDAGDPINGKVEGNRLGTYGQASPIPGKARDFLGISKTDLQKILRSYPLRNDERRAQSVEEVRSAERVAQDILSRTGFVEDDDS
jgi:hypothetical protein